MIPPAESTLQWKAATPGLIDLVFADERIISLVEPKFTPDSVFGLRGYRTDPTRDRVAGVDSVKTGFALSDVYGFVWNKPPGRTVINEWGNTVEDSRQVRLYLTDGSRITMVSPVQSDYWVWGNVSEWLRPRGSDPEYWTRPDLVPLTGLQQGSVATIEVRRIDPGKTLAAILIGVPLTALLGVLVAYAIACGWVDQNGFLCY